MSSRAAALYALQDIDLEIDARRQRLGEIQAALSEGETLRQARAALTVAEEELHRWQTRQRNQELEIASLAAKVSETETLLYSGKVRNPKELGDLQAEMAALGRQRGAREDELLEAMVHVEDQSASVDAARRTLAEVEEATLASQANLRAEAAQVEERLATLMDEREMQLMQSNAADVRAYEALRQRKRGQAVALLEYNSCSACGVALASSRLQQARQSEELTTCPNCDRILYVP
jgi:predicted  nucleic acid-binding Zn-ribbon protein